jgi:glycosyltransferase involved in cell wall biosynthesis
MTNEKILIVGDTLTGPTGFAINGLNLSWALSKEFDIHYLGLQSVQQDKISITMEGEKRDIIQYPNLPKDENAKWDFGFKSIPYLLNTLKPDIIFSINDIQMIRHIPNIICPSHIKLKAIDLPAKHFLSDDAMKMQLEGEVQRFKEKYPLDVKFVSYAPQDGDPPMQDWGYIYRMADKVIAMSKYGQDIFKKFYNLDVPYMWHGVDSAIFKPGDRPENIKDKFIIGDINRNQPRKYPIRIIEAFSKFAKDKPDVLLHMQKDWNDSFGWPLKYFTDLYGITSKCIKPGQVGMPREEIATVYNAWDINLCCTGGEGFGLSIAEGMMCGVPTLANDYTTSKELIIDGKPGPRGMLTNCELHWELLTTSATRRALVSIDDLVTKLNKYYYNRDLLKKHGDDSYTWAKKHLSIANQQDQWISIMKDVLNDK